MNIHFEICESAAKALARESQLKDNGVPSARTLHVNGIIIDDRRSDPDALTQAIGVVSGSFHAVQYET